MIDDRVIYFAFVSSWLAQKCLLRNTFFYMETNFYFHSDWKFQVWKCILIPTHKRSQLHLRKLTWKRLFFRYNQKKNKAKQKSRINEMNTFLFCFFTCVGDVTSFNRRWSLVVWSSQAHVITLFHFFVLEVFDVNFHSLGTLISVVRIQSTFAVAL